jgi:hypothetical protein
MCVHRAFLLSLGVLLLALPAALRPVSAQGVASGFHGTWWLSAGPPAPRPLILTLSALGTFVLEDAIDGGGHTFSGDAFSPTQGTWTGGPGRTARALGLRFVYDAVGKTEAVERVRLDLRLTDGFDRLEGAYQLEEMFCTEQATPLPLTVPVCPDPTIAPTEVLRGPAPLTGVRVVIGAPVD